jgi:hypothetical protein
MYSSHTKLAINHWSVCVTSQVRCSETVTGKHHSRTRRQGAVTYSLRTLPVTVRITVCMEPERVWGTQRKLLRQDNKIQQPVNALCSWSAGISCYYCLVWQGTTPWKLEAPCFQRSNGPWHIFVCPVAGCTQTAWRCHRCYNPDRKHRQLALTVQAVLENTHGQAPYHQSILHDTVQYLPTRPHWCSPSSCALLVATILYTACSIGLVWSLQFSAGCIK